MRQSGATSEANGCPCCLPALTPSRIGVAPRGDTVTTESRELRALARQVLAVRFQVLSAGLVFSALQLCELRLQLSVLNPKRIPRMLVETVCISHQILRPERIPSETPQRAARRAKCQSASRQRSQGALSGYSYRDHSLQIQHALALLAHCPAALEMRRLPLLLQGAHDAYLALPLCPVQRRLRSAQNSRCTYS